MTNILYGFLEYLQVHDNAKIMDIARGVTISRAMVTKSIRKLIQNGMVLVVSLNGVGISYNLTGTSEELSAK